MSLITVITDPAVGGTFLSWSLLWLSGQEQHYNCRKSMAQPVCARPLNDVNAHGFEVNHVTTVGELDRALTDLRPRAAADHQVIYFHNFEYDRGEQSWPFDAALDAHNVSRACVRSDRTLVVYLPSEHYLYYNKFETRKLRKKWSDLSSVCKDAQEQHREFIAYFFGDDLDRWNSQGLVDVWDYREFLALNLRPDQQARFELDMFSNHDCFRISATDLWFCLDLTIVDIFEYLDLTLDSDRWQSWLEQYQSWKQIHYERMKFVWAFDFIMQSILHGRDLDLARFNLDIMREAAIQHSLIYKHNLNLKSHGLDKFVNTKQLHNLLEPNCHQLISEPTSYLTL